MKYKYIFFLFFISCINDSNKNFELKYYRFEEKLFNLNSENISEGLDSLRKENLSFFSIFQREIVRNEGLSDQEYEKEILRFIDHSDMREAYDSVHLYFNDFSDIISELNTAFSIFNQHFPSYPIPNITTFFGGFNYGVFSYEDNIAIGLENFLGKSSKYYNLLENPYYLRLQRQRKFITPNVIETFYNLHFLNYKNINNNFLSEIIYRGKIMYFMDKLTPGILLSTKFRFSNEQMNWAIKNEYSVWTYFIENDLLYSSYEQNYRSYLNHAPFSKGMPRDAPSRIAYYIGYKIIKSYMQNNNVSLKELVVKNDVNDILKKSKYKPRK